MWDKKDRTRNMVALKVHLMEGTSALRREWESRYEMRVPPRATFVWLGGDLEMCVEVQMEWPRVKDAVDEIWEDISAMCERACGIFDAGMEVLNTNPAGTRSPFTSGRPDSWRILFHQIGPGRGRAR